MILQTWRRHDMDTLSTLLALCVGNPLFNQHKGSNFDGSFVVSLENWTNSWIDGEMKRPNAHVMTST